MIEGDAKMNEQNKTTLSNQNTQNKVQVEDKVQGDIATFAGGCFWCMEAAFQDIPGVLDAVSGYSGGEKENPSYSEVSAGKTKHYEAVQIKFDPQKITYNELLDIFWKSIDPTDSEGQFADRGNQYKTAIMYHNDAQRIFAESSKKQLEESGQFDKPIATKILPYKNFFEAEEYHQDYFLKRTASYQAYKYGSGRVTKLKELWADYKEETEEELKNRLSTLQFKVTQQGATEPAFNNEYWDNKAEGIYVDVVTGEPLFSSTDKYDSGTGWPSFTKPINEEAIVEVPDNSFFVKRTEVKSSQGNSHLGHVFDDGPGETGERFCMNSASLKFIPKEEMKKQGYEEYLYLFE